MIILQVIGVLGLVALIWLTSYFDKKNDPVLASISFAFLITYALLGAAFISYFNK